MAVGITVVARSALVVVLLAGIAMAGCAGGEGAEAPPKAEEPMADASSGLGSIKGLVLNEELVGISGVTVAILERNLDTLTDADGVFVFNNLEPGSVRVFAQRLGYESVGRSVTVSPGAIAEVQIELQQIKTAEPFHEVQELEGRISCGVGTAAVTVWVNCAAVTGTHVTTLDFQVNSGVSASMSETVWESTTALSSTELLVNEIFDGDLRCDRCQGASPIVLVTDKYKDDVEDETVLRHTYFTGFGAGGLPVAFSIDQSFNVYVSVFYHQAIPAGWTAAPS